MLRDTIRLKPAVSAALPPFCPEPFRVLIDRLDAGGVRYCHWKSNIRLADSLDGDDDLDLLVHREDATAFLVAAEEAGFKLARSTAGIGHPGVFHALALDTERGRLLHLHGYFQIVTGDSLVKSFRLPLEPDLLASTVRLNGVPVPSPGVELALFALRVPLKHIALAEIAMVSRGYDAIPAELAWLDARTDRNAAGAVFRAWIPGADPGLFERTLAAIADERALLDRIAVGREIARRLAPWRRLGRTASLISRWRRVAAMAQARVRRRRDLSLHSGGMVIAIVGPKATGKSTLGGALAQCLGEHLDVRRVHAGKPPATALSFGPRLLVPLARALLPSERPGAYEHPERRDRAEYSLIYVLRMALLAHDRRVLLRRIWRAAAGGAIVITDRYPSETVGAVDSRCFDDATIERCGRGPKRWLMQWERSLCRGVPNPGLILRLVAAPETAVHRDSRREKEGGPDADAVLRRWEMETRADFGSTPVRPIDTDRALEASIRDVIRSAWDAL